MLASARVRGLPGSHPVSGLRGDASSRRPYHDRGDHNTRAHYGVRTRTHKLIYFWKKDQWELFDLVHDRFELHNLYAQSGQEQLTATLEAELQRLKQSVRDDDQLANEQLPNGVDGTVERLRGK